MTLHLSGSGLGPAVSAEIRAEMARQHITVVSLAKAIGVRRATLSTHLNAGSLITFSLVSQAARELGVSVAELTGRAEARIAADGAGVDAHQQVGPQADRIETGAGTES